MGCRKEDEANDATTQPTAEPPLVREATSADVTLRVTVEPPRPTVAEAVRLTVEASAPEGVELELGDLASKIEDFRVVQAEPMQAHVADGVRRVRQTIILESNLSGIRQVPSVSVTFDGGDVTTEGFSVPVASAIEGDPDPRQFADIQPPLPLERPLPWMTAAVATAVLALLAGTLLLLLRRRRSEASMELPPPPHVWALRQIERLLEERLVQAGRVQEFYYRLSGIVRTYIELRFALMAPERTTQEFLADAQRSVLLSFGHKDLLRDFLVSCDMVKFARHEPAGAEVDQAIASARRFIEETAPAERKAEASAA